MTSGDKGEAPETMERTLPPNIAFILLNTNLSHIGDDFFPEIFIRKNSFWISERTTYYLIFLDK